MPRYVIHIGPPKTGSKYLQSMFYYSRQTLRELGVYYAEDWWTAPDQIMHWRLFDEIRRGSASDLRQQFDRINAAGHRIVLLSCEGFDDLQPEHLQLWRRAMGRHPVDIVYYCRRWSERIPSDWQQHIKMGQFPTLPEFYAHYLRAPTDSPSVNYSIVWDKFTRVFGVGSLHLVSYNNLRDHHVDLFAHFARVFLGLHTLPGVEHHLIQANISPDPYDTEILRVLNYLDHRQVGRTRLDMRVKFLELRARWDTCALAGLMEPEVATLEFQDDSEPFRASWAAMSAYRKRLSSREFGRPFFRRTTAAFRYVRPDDLSKAGASEALRALYREISETHFEHPEVE